MSGKIVILGAFMADTAYRADRQPRMGETLLGKGFALGPGGKGSNQAVAAARAGGDVHFISRLGADPFAAIARETWRAAGVAPEVFEDAESYTGAACIFVDDRTGDNAIIIAPGAASRISVADIERNAALIGSASVFVTQLEQPLDAAARALALAREAGVTTILNPAPAPAGGTELAASLLASCDYLTPNESEAEALTGVPVRTIADAERAAEALLARGVGAAVVTLGENGALYRDRARMAHVPAMRAGRVVETTGAGDAFNGGLAVALAAGADPVEAVRFGSATAAISVTRPGAAAAMPARDEIAALLRRAGA